MSFKVLEKFYGCIKEERGVRVAEGGSPGCMLTLTCLIGREFVQVSVRFHWLGGLELRVWDQHVVGTVARVDLYLFPLGRGKYTRWKLMKGTIPKEFHISI